MKTSAAAARAQASKTPTGIGGFDEMTRGGLPRSRTTLLLGGPGSGKTIFSLQFLVHGIAAHKEPGIFVAFEETSERIIENAASFGWNLLQLQARHQLYFMNAQPTPDLIQSGSFDLNGMLAILEIQCDQLKVRRIVFDALDILLALLPDDASRRREIYRLHDWLLKRGLTAIITAKSGADEANAVIQQPFGFMQFMVDCAVILNHSVSSGVSHRNLRVQKYRGSAFDENESPVLIGLAGLQVATAPPATRQHAKVSTARVSSGVARLDTMLGGGYYRGASVLITGFPGTAKTTLSGAFAHAACMRGERTLFVSFDTDCNEVIRDLSSVGIQMAPHHKSGMLRMASARHISGSAETYLAQIRSMAEEQQARCMVVDPMSTWSQSGYASNAHSVAERLTDWTKSMGITLLCTSLVDETTSQTHSGPSLQISTLADTWIHLSYLVQAGERNRGLSIIKSRGTAHSNQVRELILSESGVTLADAYTAGGEVLMGTLRWQKERAERIASEVAEAAETLRRVQLDADEAELEVRMKSLQVEIEAKRVERARLIQTTKTHEGDLSQGRAHMKQLRGADQTAPRRK